MNTSCTEYVSFIRHLLGVERDLLKSTLGCDVSGSSLTHVDDTVEGVAAPLSGTAWIATIVDCYGVCTGAAAFVVLMKLLERSNVILVGYIMCPITPINIRPVQNQ